MLDVAKYSCYTLARLLTLVLYNENLSQKEKSYMFLVLELDGLSQCVPLIELIVYLKISSSASTAFLNIRTTEKRAEIISWK